MSPVGNPKLWRNRCACNANFPARDSPRPPRAIHNLNNREARIIDMKSSMKDKIKGAAAKVKGGAKENVGKATNDRDMQASGTADKAGGKVRSKVGDVKKVFGK